MGNSNGIYYTCKRGFYIKMPLILLKTEKKRNLWNVRWKKNIVT